MGRFLERVLPLGVGIACAILIKYIDINSITNLKDIVLSIINFVAILIGFLTTMLSILVTSSDKPIMIFIKEKKRIKDLYIYLTIPVLVGFVLIINCLLFIPISEVKDLKNYINFYLVGFFLLYFILSCIRSIIVLLLLLFNFADDPKRNNHELDLSNSFKDNNKQ